MDKIDKDEFLFLVKEVIQENPDWLSELQMAIMHGVKSRLQEEIDYRARAETSLSVCYDAINGYTDLYERCKDDVVAALKSSKMFGGTKYAKNL